MEAPDLHRRLEPVEQHRLTSYRRAWNVPGDLLNDLAGRGVAGVADAGDGALGVVVADHALEGDDGAGGRVLDGVGELGDADGGLSDLGAYHAGSGSRERPVGLVGAGRHGVSSIGAAGWA